MPDIKLTGKLSNRGSSTERKIREKELIPTPPFKPAHRQIEFLPTFTTPPIKAEERAEEISDDPRMERRPA
jgi:hypothetical protein